MLHHGVEGCGACAAGQTAERSGHVILQALQTGRMRQTLDLRNGATQSTLSLPEGSHCFIHLPPLPEQAARHPASRSMALADPLQALRLVVDAVVADTAALRVAGGRIG